MKNLHHLDDKPIHPLYRFIRWAVWKLSPVYELRGAERIPEGPCVIVGNHCQMYGPIAGELYTPGKHAIWCIGEMMHRKEVPAYAFQDFWSNKPGSVRWVFRIFSYLIAPLSQLVFTNAHTIPVYHDARLMTTFRESVSALGEGARVVIYPECYTRHNNIVYAFQEKFVDLARLYRRKTGEDLVFVPQYLAPRLGTLSFGEPTAFRPEAPIEEERRRICAHLMDEITRLALEQPEHTVVPYPNIPKKQYPKSQPLEVYEDAETR